MTEPALGSSGAAIEPRDEHNLRLLANVHPEDWINPEAKERYHLVVIGGGTAGLVSAAGAAGLGAKVALIEKGLMGGDCLNVGCVPSKGVIRAARAWSESRRGPERFGAPPVSGDGDFAAAMERMRRIRADISKHDSFHRFRDLGIDVFLGEGRFVASDAAEVDGQRLRFRRAVIATGGRAIAPAFPGLEEAGYLTNETVFNLTEVPKRLAVIGAGPIGCEMAQSFARFGSEVTVFDIAPQILIREDPDAAKLIERALLADGISFALAASIGGVKTRGSAKIVHYKQGDEEKSVAVDALLLAVGRAPNIEALSLDAAGVKYHEKGVEVDDRMRTSNPKIYAAGDVASKYQFTHAADALARIVIQNALFFGRAKASDLVIPWCTYTSPEIAHVGLYEREAKDRGIETDTLTLPLSDVDRALLDGEEEGFLRLHLTKGGDKILGATLVAEHAGEMISELTLAINAGVGLGKIASVIHPYPTQAEVIKKAADARRRDKLTPTARKIFDLFFRIFK